MGKKKKSSGPRLRKEMRPVSAEPPKKGWDRFYIWVVLAICTVSFFVHLQGADYLRRQGMLTFDESIYSQLGFQLKNGKAYDTQDIYEQQKKAGRTLPAYVNRPVFHHPPLFSWTISMMYSFMEQKPAYAMDELYSMAVKVSNFAGCGLILLIFFLARRLFNPHVGLLAAFFASIEFNILMCSTKNWIDMTLALMVWLTLYLFYRSTQHKYFFYIAGLVAGLALLTKYTAVLIFPVFISYCVLFKRSVFKQKEFYFSLALAALVFSPWMAHNISVYGWEKYLEASGSSGYKARIVQFGQMVGVLAVVLGAIIAVQKYMLPQNIKEGARSSWGWVGTGAACLFFAYLCLQKPFWVSFYQSWVWTPDVLTGWEIGMFRDEPWYFYIKQHMEYSLLYVIFFVGFVLSFRKTEGDVFCALAAFWILTFGILWKNFQGRYVLGFTPAAMMLAAVTTWRYFRWLWDKKGVYAKVAISFSFLILGYVILKTCHVGYTYALNDSVAYF